MSQPKVKCKRCIKGFKNIQQLDHHLVAHNCWRCAPFHCNENCQKNFAYKKKLSNHMFIHSKEQTLMCVFESRFKKMNHLGVTANLHTSRKSPEKPVKMRTFQDQSERLKHSMLSTKKDGFKCSMCGKEFVSRKRFSIHMSYHTREKPCKCYRCGMNFRCEKDLYKHFESHIDERKEGDVDVCGTDDEENEDDLDTSYSSSPNIDVQNIDDTSNMGESSSLIPTKERGDEILPNEMKSDSSVPITGNGYSTVCNIINRPMSETEGKPYACSLCGKAFKHKFNMKAHEILHSGNRPYSCDICGNDYIRKDHLKNHMKSKHPYEMSSKSSLSRNNPLQTELDHTEINDNVAELEKDAQSQLVDEMPMELTPPQHLEDMVPQRETGQLEQQHAVNSDDSQEWISTTQEVNGKQCSVIVINEDEADQPTVIRLNLNSQDHGKTSKHCSAGNGKSQKEGTGFDNAILLSDDDDDDIDEPLTVMLGDGGSEKTFPQNANGTSQVEKGGHWKHDSIIVLDDNLAVETYTVKPTENTPQPASLNAHSHERVNTPELQPHLTGSSDSVAMLKKDMPPQALTTRHEEDMEVESNSPTLSQDQTGSLDTNKQQSGTTDSQSNPPLFILQGTVQKQNGHQTYQKEQIGSVQLEQGCVANDDEIMMHDAYANAEPYIASPQENIPTQPGTHIVTSFGDVVNKVVSRLIRTPTGSVSEDSGYETHCQEAVNALQDPPQEKKSPLEDSPQEAVSGSLHPAQENVSTWQHTPQKNVSALQHPPQEVVSVSLHPPQGNVSAYQRQHQHANSSHGMLEKSVPPQQFLNVPQQHAPDHNGYSSYGAVVGSLQFEQQSGGSYNSFQDKQPKHPFAAHQGIAPDQNGQHLDPQGELSSLQLQENEIFNTHSQMIKLLVAQQGQTEIQDKGSVSESQRTARQYSISPSSVRDGHTMNAGQEYSQDIHKKINSQKQLGEPEKLPPQCPICSKTFTRVDNLSNHMQVHDSHRPYACSVCGKTFKKQAHLDTHSVVHVDGFPHQCDVCGMGFKFLKTLKKHSKQHNGDQRSDYGQQSYSGDSRSSCGSLNYMSEQTAEHHQREKTNDSYASHIAPVSGIQRDRPHVCGICGKSFRAQMYLKQHQEIHNQEQAHKCEICGLGFKRKCHYSRHVKQHYKKQTVESNLSAGKQSVKTEVFVDEAERSRGTANHFTIGETANGQFVHQIPHTNQILQMNHMQGQEFPHLTVHQASHSNGGSFKCTLCGDVFALQWQLEKHYELHTTVPTATSNMTATKQSDTDSVSEGSKSGRVSLHSLWKDSSERYREVKPNIAYNSHTAPKNHTEVRDEQPFKCDTCGQIFKTQGSLGTHQLKHTTECPFTCAICGKGFKKKGYLTNHFKKHVREQAEEWNLYAEQPEDNAAVGDAKSSSDSPYPVPEHSAGTNTVERMNVPDVIKESVLSGFDVSALYYVSEQTAEVNSGERTNGQDGSKESVTSGVDTSALNSTSDHTTERNAPERMSEPVGSGHIAQSGSNKSASHHVLEHNTEGNPGERTNEQPVSEGSGQSGLDESALYSVAEKTTERNSLERTIESILSGFDKSRVAEETVVRNTAERMNEPPFSKQSIQNGFKEAGLYSLLGLTAEENAAESMNEPIVSGDTVQSGFDNSALYRLSEHTTETNGSERMNGPPMSMEGVQSGFIDSALYHTSEHTTESNAAERMNEHCVRGKCPKWV